MTGETPPACSLDNATLEERLAAIAEIGADRLISRQLEDGGHLLRFRADAATRKRLEQVVAAEAECCAFLDLSLAEKGGELMLSIAAPPEARALASGLAARFGPAQPGRPRPDAS
jgi:hypothetical protein